MQRAVRLDQSAIPVEETANLLGDHQGLLAILTKPVTGADQRRAGVVMLNAGLLHRVGPYRLYVTLARRLATLGFPVVRLDISGKGDSSRRPAMGYTESLVRDIEDARTLLSKTAKIDRIVVLGLCSGADDALAVASKCKEVVGVVLLDGYAPRTPGYYWRHYAQRVPNPRAWLAVAKSVGRSLGLAPKELRRDSTTEMSDEREFDSHEVMRERFKELLRRGTRLFCVYTLGARAYYNREGQLGSALGVDGESAGLTEVYWPEAKHTYPIASHREQVVEKICLWFNSTFSADGR